MAFLATSLGTPPLCIRGNVQYEQQTLIPDSGLFNYTTHQDNNWSFINSLRFQNGRIRGNYSLEDNFEQGYFNFENWTGRICYSTDGTKSGYMSILPSGGPHLANFWHRGDDAVSRDALYNYGFTGNHPNRTIVPRNITTCCVMSGVNNGVNGTYPNMEIYIGSIPSGNITVYGRVGSVNQYYRYTDKLLSFEVPTVIAGGSTNYTTGPSFAGTGADELGSGTGIWTLPGNVTASDSNYASISKSAMPPGSLTSNYLRATNFGFSVPTGAIIDGVEVTISRFADVLGIGNVVDNSIKILIGGVESGTDIDTGATWGTSIQTDTIGGPTTLGGLTITPAQANASDFGISIKADITATTVQTIAKIDWIKIKLYYHIAVDDESTNVSGNITLINKYDGEERRLNWVGEGFGDTTHIDMPNNRVTSKEFSNFLMSYSSSDGIARFYTAYDNEPFELENVVDVGNITGAFTGKTIFHEDSYINTGNETINNPKIWTDYGISNRAWTITEIREFDHHRLNGGYYIAENPATSYATPSGSDISYLSFHFPVKSSGTLGSCHSGDFRATNYYVPLNSGVNDRLFEFDRSQFNGTALTLDMWVGNTGTNPSGNIEARIDFCARSGYFSRDLYTPTHYWSGFSIQVPSGISQVRMSGLVYNKNHGLSDLSEVSKNNANNAELFLGSWYNNIWREYNGDIKVYSARVGLDGFVSPARASGQIDLYCSGEQKTTGRTTLYLQNSHADANTTLYLSGKVNTSGTIPLVITGGFTSNYCNLFIGGKASSSGSIPLCITGAKETASIPLYIYSSPPSQGSGQMNLYMWATAYSGSSNSMNLFIGENAPSGVKTASMNLFTKGPDSTRVTAGMNLFLDSDAPIAKNSLSLFCANYYTGYSGYLTLFLQTKSGTLGAIPASANMNLFLNRGIESVAHNMPLFIGGPSSINSGVDLFMTGANKSNGAIPLYTDGIGVTPGTLKLYTHGF